VFGACAPAGAGEHLTAPLGADEGETVRRINTRTALAAMGAMVLATACGGGDKGPTGPGGGDPGVGAEGYYQLVALGGIEVPADLQVEDCIVTRFHGGDLWLQDDGTWQLQIGFSDDNYDGATATDEGDFEQDGSTLWLTSAYSGVSHEARIGGGEVQIAYDWCFNGVPDVQLVLER
jgi:hypothetical protein